MRRSEAPLSHLPNLRQSIKQPQEHRMRKACHAANSCIHRCSPFPMMQELDQVL